MNINNLKINKPPKNRKNIIPYSSNYITNIDGTVTDIYSKLLNDRIIFLTTEIDSYSANIIKSQLLYLNKVSNEPISIYIDSPGGDVYTGLGIIDMMDFVDCEVNTVNIGLAASMAAVILAYGDNRKCLKRSRTMIHQPLAYIGYSQATDIEINANQVLELKNELCSILAEKTGKDIERIITDSDRDYWLSSSEALSYGLIDEIQ